MSVAFARSPKRRSWPRVAMFAALSSSLLLAAGAARGADSGAVDAPRFPAAHAIKGARLVVAPGKVVEEGTIVVRDGLIEAVGPAGEVEIPHDAQVIDGKGLVVYPGFIDLYTTAGQRAGVERSATGTGKPVELSETTLAATPTDNRKGLTPEFQVAEILDLDDALAEPRRKLGFTDLLSAPAGAIATGQSALVALSGEPRREALLKAPVALHVQVATPRNPSAQASGVQGPRGFGFGGPREGGAENPYPRSLMGSVAHLRQAMSDAEHHHRLIEYVKNGGAARVAADPALEALWEAREKRLPVWWEAETRDEIHRALDLAAEFGTTAVIVGGHEALKVVDRLKAEKAAVVLRLDFPEAPKAPAETEYAKRPDADQDEPLKLLVDRKDKWKERVATAAALAKAGVPIAFGTEGIEKLDAAPAKLRTLLGEGLTPDQALDALTRSAAAIAGVDGRLGTLEPGKLAHVVAFTAPFQETKARVKHLLIDGRKFEIETPAAPAGPGRPDARRGPGGPPAEKPEATKEKAEEKPEANKEKSDKPEAEKAEEKPKPEAEKTEEKPFHDVATEFDADRAPKLKTGGNVLIKDAVILTVTKGTIPRGSILIENGKIKAIGPDLEAPEGVTVIDAAGLVAMPGMIDAHSHIAVDGGVNEMSLSVVPDVRVKDVVTGDDVSIYRALAGGTTIARVLHGSANTIGGQDAVLKLRYGQPGRELILRDGPQGVKFALGENVIRSTGRFPNTRMGVESVIDGAFTEARAYQLAWKAYSQKVAEAGEANAGPPPRRDFRLEALARMLDGSIKIHSHCYRADEIIMLMRTAEKHGVRIRSLQHALEAYKVAPEIAAHGASVSTFSDWWAYKIEAFDAIPYNAPMLTRAGIDAGIKSDSEELIRHLNLEAAKMVKYGGVSEEEALAYVTISPARQLDRDDRVGSLEVGKDGDVAIFNGHPFDAYSRCEMTLIDGEVYFQRPSADGKLAARPGDHVKMPRAADDAVNHNLAFTSQPKNDYALLGATLHPVSGPAIENGVIAIVDGKIAVIGPEGTPVPPEAQTLEVKGLDIWPGLIDAGSTVGLSEIGSLSETHDYADAGRYQPELRASTAIRADSEIIPVTRANGVLAALVEPTGGLISGQSALAKLDGWVPREMALVDPLALSVRIPAYIARPTGAGAFRGPGSGADDGRSRRKKQLEELKQQFLDAKLYDQVVAAAEAKGGPKPAPEPRLAALAPYAKGEKLVILRAEHRNEILDAIDLARELKLKAVISGASEAWKVANQIKESGLPVIIGGVLNTPRYDHDPYDSAYFNAAKLHEAGVPFAIKSKAGGASAATNGRNLPYEAATAAAFGLPEDAALRAVTLSPAEILGVADQLGSLEVGKRANLVITAGDLLQATTPVLSLFIDGKPVSTANRQTDLRDKYQKRLDEVKAHRAPIGLERPAAAAVESR